MGSVKKPFDDAHKETRLVLSAAGGELENLSNINDIVFTLKCRNICVNFGGHMVLTSVMAILKFCNDQMNNSYRNVPLKNMLNPGTMAGKKNMKKTSTVPFLRQM